MEDKEIIANIDEFKIEDLDIIFKTCQYQVKEGKKYIVRNVILEENVKKYKPEELTADFIPTIDTQLKEIEGTDYKELYENDIKLYNHEMLQRVKCLSLKKLGKDIMTNTSCLKDKDKKKLQEIMHSYNEIDHDKIISDFNEVVNEDLFEDNTDMTKYPVYKTF